MSFSVLVPADLLGEAVDVQVTDAATMAVLRSLLQRAGVPPGTGPARKHDLQQRLAAAVSAHVALPPTGATPPPPPQNAQPNGQLAGAGQAGLAPFQRLPDGLCHVPPDSALAAAAANLADLWAGQDMMALGTVIAALLSAVKLSPGANRLLVGAMPTPEALARIDALLVGATATPSPSPSALVRVFAERGRGLGINLTERDFASRSGGFPGTPSVWDDSFTGLPLDAFAGAYEYGAFVIGFGAGDDGYFGPGGGAAEGERRLKEFALPAPRTSLRSGARAFLNSSALPAAIRRFPLDPVGVVEEARLLLEARGDAAGLLESRVHDLLAAEFPALQRIVGESAETSAAVTSLKRLGMAARVQLVPLSSAGVAALASKVSEVDYALPDPAGVPAAAGARQHPGSAQDLVAVVEKALRRQADLKHGSPQASASSGEGPSLPVNLERSVHSIQGDLEEIQRMEDGMAVLTKVVGSGNAAMRTALLYGGGTAMARTSWAFVIIAGVAPLAHQFLAEQLLRGLEVPSDMTLGLSVDLRSLGINIAGYLASKAPSEKDLLAIYPKFRRAVTGLEPPVPLSFEDACRTLAEMTSFFDFVLALFSACSIEAPDLDSYASRIFAIAQRAGESADSVASEAAAQDLRAALVAFDVQFSLWGKTLPLDPPPPFWIGDIAMEHLRSAVVTAASIHSGLRFGLFGHLVKSTAPPSPPGHRASPAAPQARADARKRGSSPSPTGPNKGGGGGQGSKVKWALSKRCGFQETGNLVEWGAFKWSLKKIKDLWASREPGSDFPGSLALVAHGNNGSWEGAKRFVDNGIKGDHLEAVRRWHADDCAQQCFC